jgi:hypothetical protein
MMLKMDGEDIKTVQDCSRHAQQQNHTRYLHTGRHTA